MRAVLQWITTLSFSTAIAVTISRISLRSLPRRAWGGFDSTLSDFAKAVDIKV